VKGLLALATRLASHFRGRRLDTELEQELGFHLDELTEKYIRSGLDRGSARNAAQREFGGVDKIMEAYRDQRGFPIISQTVQDLRYGIRILTGSPAATVIAVLALGLGIGANACMFTSVQAVLLKPLPFEDLDSIVRIWDSDPKHGATYNMVSPADFVDWREQSRSFEHMGAFASWDANMTGVSDPERLQGYAVSPGFFFALGMQPLLGRSFWASEEIPGRDQVVVLSHGLWQRRFAGDRGILGKQIAIDGNNYDVVGVLPPDFDFPLGTDVWKPLALSAEQRNSRDGRILFVLGRLKRGVSAGQAGAEMEAISGRLAARYPQTNDGHGARVQRLRDVLNMVTDRFIIVLTAAAGFVLLLACSNVASIQLARTNSRVRELALRATLGAGRSRIARQLLVENILLAAMGAALGIAFAFWGLSLIRLGIPPQVYRWVAGLRNMRIDGTVLAFTAGVALLTGILCGIGPALQASRRRDLGETLKEGGRSTSSGGRQSLRKALVVAEVAMTLVLLVSAGMMVKAFQHMMTFDMGFNPKNLISMRQSLPATKYREASLVRSYYERVLENLRRVPDVTAVGAAGSDAQMTVFRVEGQAPALPGEPLPGMQLIAGDYFAAMGMKVTRGRPLTVRDEGPNPAHVAVVSEGVVRRWWKNSQDPIGTVIRVGRYDIPPLTVVGVVGDVKDWFTGAGQPTVYISSAHMPQLSMGLVARTNKDSGRTLSIARAQVQVVDPNQPVYDVKSMEQILNEQTSGVRMAAVMMSGFAVIALLLAVTGTYGIVAFSVSQRTQEFGIRMALGARSRDVLALVTGQAVRLTAFGLVIGACAAFGVAGLMSSVLYGIVSPDPLTFAGLSTVLAVSAVLAGYLPARRATKVDPIVALRCE
jgi:putative ABC transport system permease protein